MAERKRTTPPNPLAPPLATAGGATNPNLIGYTSAADLNSKAPDKLNRGLITLDIGYQWAPGTAANGAPMWQDVYLPVTVTTKK